MGMISRTLRRRLERGMHSLYKVPVLGEALRHRKLRRAGANPEITEIRDRFRGIMQQSFERIYVDYNVSNHRNAQLLRDRLLLDVSVALAREKLGGRLLTPEIGEILIQSEMSRAQANTGSDERAIDRNLQGMLLELVGEKKYEILMDALFSESAKADAAIHYEWNSFLRGRMA